MALETKKNSTQMVRSRGYDAYTALLGLTVLVLAVTAALVCFYGQTMFGEIFVVTPR
jgi:hypothetical protein